VKAFFDAGGGDLVTLGTDHPSWGEFFTPFSVNRELLSLSLSGIPNAAVLRIATINRARAMGLGDRSGSIEPAKWADLVVVRGNPLQDIRRVRMPRLVVKAGRVYDPEALMKSVEGKIGPMSAADTAAWSPAPRRRPEPFENEPRSFYTRITHQILTPYVENDIDRACPARVSPTRPPSS
jgi:adenine deaminase